MKYYSIVMIIVVVKVMVIVNDMDVVKVICLLFSIVVKILTQLAFFRLLMLLIKINLL